MAASNESRGDGMSAALTLTVLGTATPYPRPGLPCSGFLLRTPATTLWVEAGPGTMAELQRHVRLEDVDAIWISHLHPDHCSDLLSVYQWRFTAEPPLPLLPVYGPPGWAQRIEAFLPNGRPGLLSGVFDIHELRDHGTSVLGDLTLTSRSVPHSVPGFGLRAEQDGRVFAYSGDSGPCAALTDLARAADLFVCESGYATSAPGQAPFHCTPEDAGRTASAAGARQLLLTHLAAGLPPEAAAARAASAYSGRISLPGVGAQVAVGAT